MALNRRLFSIFKEIQVFGHFRSSVTRKKESMNRAAWTLVVKDMFSSTFDLNFSSIALMVWSLHGLKDRRLFSNFHGNARFWTFSLLRRSEKGEDEQSCMDPSCERHVQFYL